VKEVLARLADGHRLEAAAMEAAVGTIMDGGATPAQVGAFLALLRAKGETATELVAAVRAMRARALPISVDGPCLDTCGTGGDGMGTFNISTATAFVCAAAGVRVAKHGNRAASGKVGAADVLEAAGATIDLQPEAAARLLGDVGITFLFAPVYHPAVRFVAGPRRELGFRTLFNLTGPLCNPAGARHQLLGLFSASWMEPVAEALRELGTTRALVVHGSDGSDEITLAGPTAILEVREGDEPFLRYELRPRDFGIEERPTDQLAGGDAAENARLLAEVLGGAPGALCDVVALNAGAALFAAAVVPDIATGVERASALLSAGEPRGVLERFVARSRELAS
jgi:anthranilate phosphoribosyltransferase